MVNLDERVRREAQAYNEDALQRDTYDSVLAHAMNGPARLRRDRLIREVMQAAERQRVLEIGCQAWTSCFLKHGLRPTQLTCINISEREIAATRPVAEAAGLDVDFRVMDAHQLEFPDRSFDLVFGTAILHHLDMDRVIPEIARVVAPGGRILFVEPLLLNPVAQLVRLLTPKARTADERPLDFKDLRRIDRFFATGNLYTELLSVPAAVVSRYFFSHPVNWLTRTVDAVDRGLLAVVPPLGPFYRTVTIHGTRRS